MAVCTSSMLNMCNVCHLDLQHCLCKKANPCQSCGFNPCRCHDMPRTCSSCGTSPCSCIRQGIGQQQSAPVGASIGAHAGSVDAYSSPAAYDPDAYAAAVEQQKQMMMQQHESQMQMQQPQAMPMTQGEARQVVDALSQRINPIDPHQRITRRLWIHTCTSLMEAQNNSKALQWRLMSDETLLKAPINSDVRMRRMGDLSNCVIAYASVLEASTQHLPSLGCQIAHMSGNTYTKFNSRFPYIIPGGGHMVTHGEKGLPIYVPKKLIGTVFFSNYAGLTEKSVLDGVKIDKDMGVALVPPGNIIMYLLFLNGWRLPFPPESIPKWENKYVLHVNLFDELREFAIQKVIRKLPYVDLSNKKFFAQFWRADVPLNENQHFISKNGDMRAIAHSPELLYQFLELPKSTILWIEVSYMILGVNQQSRAASSAATTFEPTMMPAQALPTASAY